ncbi:MAG: PAS domain-containing sensor histidine kinase [Chloroflexota bacterium]|nr:PAS domain-containing sensor histidine kinase [Chloroflexota bacterium]
MDAAAVRPHTWLDFGPGWLFASIRDAVVVVEAGTRRIVLCNPAACALFGYESRDMPGRRLEELVTDLEHAPQWLAACAGQRPGEVVELFAQRKSRAEVCVELSLSPLDQARDGRAYVLAIIRDITERRQAEEERIERLREQVISAESAAAQRRMAVLAEASRLLDASLDYEATLQEVARVAVRTLADWCIVHLLEEDGSIRRLAVAHGDPAKEAVARELQARYPSTEGVERVLKTGQSEIFAYIPESQRVARARDPEHLRLLHELDSRAVMIVPLAARGRMLGALSLISTRPDRSYGGGDLAIAEELARRCAHAVDNARLHREARTALKARDRFVQIASHELRTPIARVKGYAEMLLAAHKDGDLNEDMLHRSLRRIDHASDRLTNLVRDLLDVSRISAGNLPLRLRPLAVADLVRDVVGRYQEQLGAEGSVSLQIIGSPGIIAGDPDRLEQVLTNLLDNGAKYSPDGAELRVRLQSKARGVLLEVQDRGIGLPPGAAERIFEPFSRASNAEERQITGMGLGLYICRNIVEQHRGRIWARSAGEGQGVLMSVWLPRPGAGTAALTSAA